MKIKALLFDKDGTLIDFEKTWFPASIKVLSTLARGNEAHLQKILSYFIFDVVTKRFAAHSPLIAESSSFYVPIIANILGREPKELLQEFDALSLQEGLKHTVPILNPKEILSHLNTKGYLFRACYKRLLCLGSRAF